MSVNCPTPCFAGVVNISRVVAHTTFSQFFLLSLNAVAFRQRFGRVELYIQAAAPRQKSWMLVKSVNPLSSGLTDYSWLQLLFCITLFYNRAGYTRGNVPILGRRPHVPCAHFTAPCPGARGQRREGTSIDPIIGRNASSARNRLASRDLLRLRALSGFGTGGGSAPTLAALWVETHTPGPALRDWSLARSA